jgi:hypothetical protein
VLVTSAFINVCVTTQEPVSVYRDIHRKTEACGAVARSVDGGQEKSYRVGQQTTAKLASVAWHAWVYRGGHCEPAYVILRLHAEGRHSFVCDGPPKTVLRSSGMP